MELYQLRTFLVVAEEKGITRAAKRLFTTPPSISAHIKSLEDEWNVTLFRRTPRGMEITEKGETLRRKAEATLLAAQDLSNHATQLAEFLMGVLRIGLNSSATFLRIPRVVEYFQEHRPGVELSLSNSDTGAIIEALKDDSLDAGFIFGPLSDEAIVLHLLTNAELAIAVPKRWEHRMIADDWLQIAQLPWISSSDYCPFEAITDRLFGRRKIEYRSATRTNDDRTKIDLVRAGLGVALVEKSETESEAAEGSLFIWQTEPIRCDLYFAHLASRRDDPLIGTLKATVLEVWDIEEEGAPSATPVVRRINR